MLTNIQEKLAEAHGRAIAATAVATKVGHCLPDRTLQGRLRAMQSDAGETRARCLQAEKAYGPVLADAMRAHAIGIDEQCADLVATWFKADTGPLAAWTFLVMTESAEVVAWRALADLVARAGHGGEPLRELAGWALPVHARHLQVALEESTILAGLLEPGRRAGAKKL